MGQNEVRSPMPTPPPAYFDGGHSFHAWPHTGAALQDIDLAAEAAAG